MGFNGILSLDLRFLDSWLVQKHQIMHSLMPYQFCFREEAGVKGQQIMNVPSEICGNGTKSNIKLQNYFVMFTCPFMITCHP